MGATQCQGMADAGSGAARLAKAFARRLSGVVNGRYYFIRPAWYDESTGEEPKEILRKLSLEPIENLTATRRGLTFNCKIMAGRPEVGTICMEAAYLLLCAFAEFETE